MKHDVIKPPGREAVNELLRELGSHVEEMEELLERLPDCIEEYLDEADETLAEAEIYLDAASRDRSINRMLGSELKAGRKELLSLLRLLEDKGIRPPEGSYIHYRRLDPGLYWQDADVPFFYSDPDEHYFSLLSEQVTKLVMFEERTPMTTSERKALREYVICKMGFEPDPEKEWLQFLDGLRSSTHQVAK